MPQSPDSYTSVSKEPKPTAGVIPEQIFEEKRMIELSKAIYQRISTGDFNYDLLTNWINELKRRLTNYETMFK